MSILDSFCSVTRAYVCKRITRLEPLSASSYHLLLENFTRNYVEVSFLLMSDESSKHFE